MTITQERPHVHSTTTPGENEIHLVKGGTDIARCGYDVSGRPRRDRDQATCVVCIELFRAEFGSFPA